MLQTLECIYAGMHLHQKYSRLPCQKLKSCTSFIENRTTHQHMRILKLTARRQDLVLDAIQTQGV